MERGRREVREKRLGQRGERERGQSQGGKLSGRHRREYESGMFTILNTTEKKITETRSQLEK